MSGEDEFGEFSSGSDGWGVQDNTNGSSDWLSDSNNQEWVSAIPNSEQPSWNTSLPELPKELSNLLSEEIPNLSDPNAFTTPGNPPDFKFSNSGSGPLGNDNENDEFGDFESSFIENTLASTTAINLQPSKSNGIPPVVTDKIESSQWEPNFSTAPNTDVGNKDSLVANETEDDEFGDFESTTAPSEPPKELCPEFGGFVSSAIDNKENQPVGDDDFGSFEAAEFVAAPLPPAQQEAPPPISVVAPPIPATATPALPSVSFSEIAENCFHLDQGSKHQQSSIDEPITVLTEQSSLWSSLQSSVKTTTPLYTWNKSHVEDQYLAALKVDPMLVYTILSFAEEMGMEPQQQESDFQWVDSPTGKEQPVEVGATLLDLTLSSPTPQEMSKNESFKLDADLMGLDFTLTDDTEQLAANQGEEQASAMKEGLAATAAANAIVDMLGLSSNPYLNEQTEDGQAFITNNSLFDQNLTSIEPTTVTTEPPVTSTSNILPASLSALQVSKEELQSLQPSQKTLDALQVSPETLKSLSEVTTNTSTSSQAPPISEAAHTLLNSLPDVTFMLSNTHIHKRT